MALIIHLFVGGYGLFAPIGFWDCSYPFIQPEQATAKLVFYQKGSWGNAVFDLYIEGKAVAEPFEERVYFEVIVPPGRLKLQTIGQNRLTEDLTFYLDTEPGQTYFLEAVMDYDFLVNKLYLAVREEAAAVKSIRQLKKQPDALKKLE